MALVWLASSKRRLAVSIIKAIIYVIVIILSLILLLGRFMAA
jgi:hypothetical protein